MKKKKESIWSSVSILPSFLVQRGFPPLPSSPRMFTIIRRGRIRGPPLKYKRVERRDGAWIVGRLHSSLPLPLSPIVQTRRRGWIALFLHCEPCFYLTVASRRKEERTAIKEPLSLRGGGGGGETMGWKRAGRRRGRKGGGGWNEEGRKKSLAWKKLVAIVGVLDWSRG